MRFFKIALETTLEYYDFTGQNPTQLCCFLLELCLGFPNIKLWNQKSRILLRNDYLDNFQKISWETSMTENSFCEAASLKPVSLQIFC